MLRTKVKANSVAHLTDARYFAAWEVEWLGFQMMPGDTHYLSPLYVKTFKEWVDGVRICGEFGLADVEDIKATIDLLGLKSIQVGMFTPLATLEALDKEVEVLQEIVVENYSDSSDIDGILSENHQYVDYFILQCSKGGVQWSDLMNGTPFSVKQLKQWTEKHPILLDIHLDEDINEQVLLEQLPIKGYCISGGEEEKVGFKNFDELDVFFEDLEVLV